MGAADEKLAEMPCEEMVEVVRIRVCLAVGTGVLDISERDEVFPEPDVGPTLPPAEKPTRDCVLRRPLPTPPPRMSTETPAISSTGTFFTVLTEVVDFRRDRLRSRVTSRSSERLPRGVN